MKPFIAKTIWFIAPFIILGFTFEYLIRKIPGDFQIKNEYLQKQGDSIQTLILGSSHAYYGIDPKFLSSKAFNAAYVSQTIDLDYKILLKFQANLRSLKTVVLPISYFTFFENLENTVESWRVKNYAIYYGIKSSNSIFDNSEILSINLRNNLNRLFYYYILKKSPITTTRLGWGTDHQSKDALDLQLTGVEAAHRHSVDTTKLASVLSTYNKNKEILIALLQWCKTRQIKVILFTPPAYVSYIKNLNKFQLDLTINTAKQIADTYQNCFYINLLNDPEFIANDYYDSNHMSEIGARKLSAIIENVITGAK